MLKSKDLYIYKNKFFADLESVGLTKVKGYEECMAVLNESNKIEEDNIGEF